MTAASPFTARNKVRTAYRYIDGDIIMNIHEFGDRNSPVILLLPGAASYWKANFGGVIDRLAEDFLVAAAAYTGFDEGDTQDFSTVTEETEKIEAYVRDHYAGSIRAAYGSSLGGLFAGLLAARHNIHMRYGILGSSDLDHAGRFGADLAGKLSGELVYPLIRNGRYSRTSLQKRYEKQLADPDPYYRAFADTLGGRKYDKSFISKASLVNQFRSALTAPLPEQIDNGETEIHIFYALKMGEKYRARYLAHFRDPVIHEQDMRHEEFLAVYPEEWCALVKTICLRNGRE